MNLKTLSTLGWTGAALAAFIMAPAPAQAQCCKTKKKKDQATQVTQRDIVDTAVAAGSFKTLAAALQAADLIDPLRGAGPFTVFAPTDAAFAKLPKGTIEALLAPEAKAKLAGILTYHVVPGRLEAAQVVKSSGANSLNGQRLDFKVEGGAAFVDGVRIVKTDIACKNGIIHVIDAVVLPSAESVLETADAAGSFGILTSLVRAAGLESVLEGQGPFTVFAPTDDAFAALPTGTVTELLRPANKKKLQAILKMHVVSGRVYSPAAVKAGTASTIGGASLKIEVAGGKATVNGAGLIKTDLDASNGVIHVIDKVILPTAERASTEAPKPQRAF